MSFFLLPFLPSFLRVTLASMFLTRDAKLWWQTMCEWMGEDKVETWEDLVKELLAQSLPMNTVWIARDACCAS